MRRAFRSVLCVTAIALLGAMITDGREARASAGLNIGGGFTPVGGDPPYDYIFDVYLNPGSTITSGDYFTIDKLPGVTWLSFGLPDNQQPDTWTPPLILQKSYEPPYASNVTWAYWGPTESVASTAQPLFLGEFEIETSVNFKSGPPVPAGTSISYSYSIDGGPVKSSSFAISDLAAVPEPSSSTIVLLIGGTAAVSGLVVRARRRRSAPTA